MLEGKKALITGADQGLGKEIAKEFLKQGASVCICSREENRLRKTVKELEGYRKSAGQRVIFQRADVGSTEDLDRLYDVVLQEFGTLDGVVNNAGIQGPIGDTTKVPWEGIEEVVRINLLGTLYSMRKAVLVFREQKKKGRIVNLSGGGATGPREYFMGQTEKGGAPLEKAARLASFLVSDRAGTMSGRLISALWDGWEDFDAHAEEIAGSDIYTLRRIVPKDRGFQWE